MIKQPKPRTVKPAAIAGKNKLSAGFEESKGRKIGRWQRSRRKGFPAYKRKPIITPKNPLKICFVCGAGVDRSASCRYNFFKKAENKFFVDKGNLGYMIHETMRKLKETVKSSDVVVLMFPMDAKKYDLKAGTKEEANGNKRRALEGELFLAEKIRERKKHFIFLDASGPEWTDPNHPEWKNIAARLWKELDKRYVFRG